MRRLRLRPLPMPEPTPAPDVVFVTGDISDVDGFMAIAEYARAEASVVFVMNYPAYLGVPDTTTAAQQPSQMGFGLGFRYGAEAVMHATRTQRFPQAPPAQVQAYETLMAAHSGNLKEAMTTVGLVLSTAVFRAFAKSPERQRFFFRVGGINTLNAFRSDTCKNEVFVYAQAAMDYAKLLNIPLRAYAGVRYSQGDVLSATPHEKLDYDNAIRQARQRLFVDFSGSMAGGADLSPLQRTQYAGAVLMGGVLSHLPPTTMPASERINRISCATMNQLYAPAATHAFVRQLAASKTPLVVVPNNAVPVIDDMRLFLRQQGLSGGIMDPLVLAYYTDQPITPPKKAFDLYSALLLLRLMKDPMWTL